MTPPIEKTVIINADSAAVWSALTEPGLMTQWMGDPEMELEIKTNWKVNCPIIIRGFNHVQFEVNGTVLQYEPNKKLGYSHLSSISGLEDRVDNYSVLEFNLTPLENQTQLSLAITNFATETIFKHLAFYWQTTIYRIKNLIEIDSK